VSERSDEIDPLRLAVGTTIRAARQRGAMSMRSLAVACGLSQPFLSAIERGQSTPSLATLYRIADVLGVAPAELLPEPGATDISVVRADEGRRVASSDRPGSAVGRLVFSDARRELEIYEYRASRSDDLDVWYEHPGDVVLHLIEGRMRFEFAGRPTIELGPGDCAVHPGKIAHRWTVVEDSRLFVVILRRGIEP